MSLSIVSFVSMVPHPSSAIPIDTFIRRGRPLRGSPAKKNVYREWAGLVTAGKGRAGHVCDHLVIEMKNKGYKPGPASSFSGPCVPAKSAWASDPISGAPLEVDFQPKISGLHGTCVPALLLGVPVAGRDQYGYITTTFGAPMAGGDQYGYITPAFSGSPWW